MLVLLCCEKDWGDGIFGTVLEGLVGIIYLKRMGCITIFDKDTLAWARCHEKISPYGRWLQWFSAICFEGVKKHHVLRSL